MSLRSRRLVFSRRRGWYRMFNRWITYIINLPGVGVHASSVELSRKERQTVRLHSRSNHHRRSLRHRPQVLGSRLNGLGINKHQHPRSGDIALSCINTPSLICLEIMLTTYILVSPDQLVATTVVQQILSTSEQHTNSSKDVGLILFSWYDPWDRTGSEFKLQP